MDSITTTVARQYRLQEWASQIRECQRRPQNLTIKGCQTPGCLYLQQEFISCFQKHEISVPVTNVMESLNDRQYAKTQTGYDSHYYTQCAII